METLSLRPYQESAVRDALEFIRSGGTRKCYVSPTGTGKSVIESAILDELLRDKRDALLITPRLEIVQGILAKRGIDTRGYTDTKLANVGIEHRVTTPIRARNRLNSNDLGYWPTTLLFDEVHHSTAFTWQELSLLAGRQQLGFTATPFRGTPKGTKEFLDYWGTPHWIMKLHEASEQGFLAFPDFKFVPLVDDDLISVTNGEFVVRTSDKLGSRYSELGGLLRDAPARPTLVTVPNRASAGECLTAFRNCGIEAEVVLGTTNRTAREDIFRRTVAGQTILIAVNVVSEGVDLPLRRLVDISPTMSPVVFVQRVGRVMRPTSEIPEVWMCCRNLERHAYLLEGCLPLEKVSAAQSAFGAPSKRASIRVTGLEGLGKFRPVAVPFADGTHGSLYSLRVIDANKHVREYVLLLHPSRVTPLIATRVNGSDSSGNRQYGTWSKIDAIPDFTAGAPGSMPSGDCTPAMVNWWKKSAKYHGLDPDATVNRKQFQALPVLANLRERVS